jgi:hypothetical protein
VHRPKSTRVRRSGPSVRLERKCLRPDARRCDTSRAVTVLPDSAAPWRSS